MPKSSSLRAALWMLGSIVAFSAMAVAGRQVGAVHDSFEVMTARSAFGFVLVIAVAALTGRLHEITADRLGGHILRNIVHFTGQNLWFWALALIPMAQLFALEFTSPIWVILLSPLFLSERLTATRLLAAALGFTGVLIVARPDIGQINPGVLAAAGSAVAFAITNIATKRLTQGQSIVTILFWLTLIQFCFGVICAGYDGIVHWPTMATLPWLALIGLCGVSAHFCLTSALSLAPASYVLPIDFLRLPLIAVVGALFYREPLDPFVFLGGGVIFLGIWINVRAQIRPNRNTAAITQP